MTSTSRSASVVAVEAGARALFAATRGRWDDETTWESLDDGSREFYREAADQCITSGMRQAIDEFVFPDREERMRGHLIPRIVFKVADSVTAVAIRLHNLALWVGGRYVE